MILTKEVTVFGPNLFGLKTGVNFVPLNEPGWFLIKRDKNKNIIKKAPIDYKIAFCLKGRIQLRHDGIIVNIWEHIGILRFLGIDEIGIEMVDGCKWPPYLGGASLYYQKLRPYLKVTRGYIPKVAVKNNFTWTYPNDSKRFVSLKTRVNHELTLIISSQWKPFCRYEETLTLNSDMINEDFMDFLINKVLPSKPQGYPGYNYYAIKVFSILGWPNLKYISWPHDYCNTDKLSYDWWLHRVQDLLGDLSLVSHVALPIGQVCSYDGGHMADLMAIKGSF